MRSTFMGFEMARSGMSASQKGIDVTGQNLTNVNTPGYTRQRVDFVSIGTLGSSRGMTTRSNLVGQGVGVSGISQIRDPFLDRRFREEYSDVGMYEQNVSILKDIESALDEVTSSGLKEAMANVVKALQDLSKNPDQSTNANIVQTAFKSLTSVLNQFSNKLVSIYEQQKFNAKVAVNDANSLMERIASLNKSISDDVSSSNANNTYGPNELLDQRNNLLDELSKYGDMHVQEETNGTVKVTLNGQTVVDGENYDAIELVHNHDNTISFNWRSSGKNMVSSTGQLKSFTDLINGNGENATGIYENYEKGIPYYQAKLDDFAKAIATSFNDTVKTKATNAVYTIDAPANPLVAPNTNVTLSIAGLTNGQINITPTGTTVAEQTASIVQQLNADAGFAALYTAKVDVDGNLELTAVDDGRNTAFTGITGWNGQNGAASFEVKVEGLNAGEATKQLFDPPGVTDITAANITISEEWSKDSDYILIDLNGDGSLDNTYALALVGLFNNDIEFGTFNGTFEDYVNDYNTELGQQITFNSTRFEASASISNEMLNRRDAVSGVSLDEEGTNLMIYDKAYKAAARLMTTLDEALDVLINRTGLVGR